MEGVSAGASAGSAAGVGEPSRAVAVGSVAVGVALSAPSGPAGHSAGPGLGAEGRGERLGESCGVGVLGCGRSMADCRQMGHFAVSISHASTHLRWYTWPHLTWGGGR